MTPTRSPFAPFVATLRRYSLLATRYALLFAFSFLAAPIAQAQTAKSRSALYTEIDTNLPSTTGAITAAILRAQLKNVVASAYNTVNADAQPIDADLTAIAALTTATYGRSLLTLADAAALRTSAALVIGTDVQAFDAELTAIAAISSNGLLARTGAGTAAARTLTGTAAEITVTNGDGAAGNPTLSLPAALTFTGKTITGGTFASPTLTTPALGTPASGVATNLTALNATQLTTGTIPAARLPTALTSINSITAAAATDLTLAGGTAGTSAVKITNTPIASNTTSGALQVVGGISTQNNIHAAGTGNFVGIGTSGNITLSTATDSRINFIAGQTAWLNYNLAADRWTFRHTSTGVTSLTLTEAAATFAVAVVTGSATRSGAGAIPIATSLVKFTSTGGAQALTLANGADGQRLTIVHDVDGGSGVLTPTTKTGFSTVTFTNAGETVSLVYVTTRGWMVTGSYLATIAP